MMLTNIPLLFISLNLLQFFHTAIGRGGERDSGLVDKSYASSGRHLSEENHLQKLNSLADGYMTNSDLEKAIKEFHGRCRRISRIYSIGKSVLGVSMWVLEISNKPGKEEAKPAFKFIGNVHGDEPVGRELLLLLANWLCDNYMKDPLATLIVDNVHLHILPSMNPDGFSLRRRGNANHVDLNRDFPDQFFQMNDDLAERQPETKAIMSWIKNIRFTASASLHGGALVANYPWDGTQDKSKSYYACPDDEAFRYMAKLYSGSHYNMSQSQEFKAGITNGAHWYPIYGGMQDWNYIYGGCFELTLEISDNKWPPANELRMIWQFNKRSMLDLVASLVKFFHTAIGRGGERDSGLVDKSYASSGRHLSEENHLQKLNSLADGYMTNSDLEKAIKEFHGRCRRISRIYSIGKSVLGVSMWVLEISNKPGKEEAKPAFKFIGNVHGDEPVGRELLLLLANWLCDNYMKDPLATLIVDNVHLHILPSMNPDGFSLRRRGNANHVDLNRDFPDQFFQMNDDLAERQPETKAIMSWIKNIRFTASASLHGGALVANYPWDGTQDKSKSYYACPDDEAFRYMAKLYSGSHYNMSQSQEFKAGITNGAHWYPIYGGMQDWNYIYGGCFELTLEISDNKWPPANELRMIWQFNKRSMLDLVASLVKSGIHGRIFSSDCGEPLPASIAIKGINYTIKASERLADYHRLLAPGHQYEVMAMMPGYKTRTTTIKIGEEAMTVDFILEPADGFAPRQCCSRNSMNIMEVILNPHYQVALTLILVLAFLCFLMRRKAIFNHLRGRKSAGQRRASAV